MYIQAPGLKITQDLLMNGYYNLIGNRYYGQPAFSNSLNKVTIKSKETKLNFIKTNYKKTDGADINIYIIKINLKEYNMEIYYGKNKGITIDDIKKDKKVEAAVNAGFFSGNGSYLPIGLLISKGKKINPLSKSWDHSGVFYITGVSYDPYGICPKDIFFDTDVIEAVQSYPILVWDSKPYVINKDNDEASRSAIAIDMKGDILLIATDSLLSGGLTLYEFSRALCKLNLNCPRALNLDGGSSTQMYLKDKLSIYSTAGFLGEDKVSNFLVVKKKKK